MTVRPLRMISGANQPRLFNIDQSVGGTFTWNLASNLKRKETAMAIFGEAYRVVGVKSERLILRGLDSGEVLTVINADPESPITEEDYPLGQIITLTDPSTQAPN